MIDISFIITIYNKSVKDVDRCLSSVKKMNSLSYEMIIVDDGSKEKLKEQYFILSQKYKAKYYYQNNQGVSAARNLGIKNANGKYIFFVDCDDVVINSQISKRDILKMPDLVIYNVIKEEINDQNIEIKTLNVEKDIKYLTQRILANQMIKDGLMNWTYGKLYSVNFLKSNNLYFNVNVKTGEDLDFVVRVVEKARKIKYIPREVYKYEFDLATGKNRMIKFPEYAIKDTNFVYQIRKNILNKYHLNTELFSINKEQTLNAYFEIYYLCVVNKLMTDRLYKELIKNLSKIEKDGKSSFFTKIKIGIVNRNLKSLAYFYYKLKMIYKNMEK